MKVLIAGRSPIVRDKFLTTMQEILDAELFAPARDQRMTFSPGRELDPEVVIIDARLPGAEGIELLMTPHQEKPILILIVLSPLVNRPEHAPPETLTLDLLASQANFSRATLQAMLKSRTDSSHFES